MGDDRSLITEVLIRYATGIDRRDWPLFRTCWTDDVVADYGDLGVFSGVDALTDLMTKIHDTMGPTYHRLSNFAIDVEGDRAAARSYVHAALMPSPAEPENWIDALGHYDDSLVRTTRGWRIAKRTSVIARVRQMP